MTSALTCNNATLKVYVPSEDNPWNEQKINHLYRRVAFGATPDTINKALTKTPSEVIDELIDQAKNATPIPAPIWANWTPKEFGLNGNIEAVLAQQEWRDLFYTECLKSESGLSQRLTIFWSNHVVASLQGYFGPPLFYKYCNLLERKSIGSFKELIHDVGITGAMLLYLNGFDSKKEAPNENYARELLELFTLGEGNGYTEQDIKEIARALTGWNKRSDKFGDISFDSNEFDTGNKTIFGRIGNWAYSDVIDILFEEREQEIAKYICGKLYRYFVSPLINETIVDQLADTFKNNNFEIDSVLNQLFKSEHFFDESVFSVLIKSPIDLEMNMIKEMELEFYEKDYIKHIRTSISLQGQKTFNHDDVSGWGGDKEWINPSTIVAKWEQTGFRLLNAITSTKIKYLLYKTFLNNLLNNEISNDVEFVTQRMLDFFFSKESIDEVTYQGALGAFKYNVPSNYFDEGRWDTNWVIIGEQVYRLMLYIRKIPEFQLK